MGDRNIDIEGNGNVIGNYNRTVTLTNNTHVHKGGSGGGGGPDGKPTGAAERLIAAMVFIAFLAWFYVRHLSDAYTALLAAAVLSSAPVLLLFALLLKAERHMVITWADALKMLLNPVVSGLVVVLLGYGSGQIDGHVVDLAMQMRVMEFWQALTGEERRAVGENAFGTVATAFAILTNAQMVIYQCAALGSQLYASPVAARLLNFTQHYRPARALTMMAVCVSLSYLSFSGKGVDAWESVRANMLTP